MQECHHPPGANERKATMTNDNPIAAYTNPYRQYIMELQHELSTCDDSKEKERIWCAIKQLELYEWRWKVVRWN